MRYGAKWTVLALIGGLAYYCVELMWRGYSHWTMAVLGGLCFLTIGSINEYLPWEMPLVQQGVVGAVIVTVAEFVAGLVLNVWLGLHIWDYSDLPFNLLGQICLPFSGLWVLLSIIAVVADDWLRYWLFGEDRPHYKIM